MQATCADPWREMQKIKKTRFLLPICRCRCIIVDRFINNYTNFIYKKKSLMLYVSNLGVNASRMSFGADIESGKYIHFFHSSIIYNLSQHLARIQTIKSIFLNT